MTAILDKMDFVIMPVLNVDGYVFTWKKVCIGHHFINAILHEFLKIFHCSDSGRFHESVTLLGKLVTSLSECKFLAMKI